MSIKLQNIVQEFSLEPFYTPDGWQGYEVSGIIDDNRIMRDGYIFLALQGETVHPIIFAEKALQLGMKAIFTDKAAVEKYLSKDDFQTIEVLKTAGVPIFIGENLFEKQAKMADYIFDSPASSFKKFAVTGTNGKTTTTYIYKYCLELLGHNTGLIGTVEIDNGKDKIPSVLTTPQGARLHQLFNDMRQNQVEYLSMEVSSHAISLDRVAGLKYDVVAFTNLTQDHLDFHPTMQEYFETKEKLFTPTYCDRAVICVDDDYGKKLYSNQKKQGIYSFSLNDTEWNLDGFYITNIQKNNVIGSSIPTSSFDLHLPKEFGDFVTITTDMQGKFNISNIGLAVASVFLSGISSEKIIETLSANILSPIVPGRMEKISDNPLVIVDFAHNPGAMETLFESFTSSSSDSENKENQLICVFGACGMRDTLKRPIMTEIAVKYCDKVVITNDDLHGEDENNIVKDMLSTVSQETIESKILIELDRHKAITQTIQSAKDNDVVLILGRGHETDFELSDGTMIKLDDREVARSTMKGRNV